MVICSFCYVLVGSNNEMYEVEENDESEVDKNINNANDDDDENEQNENINNNIILNNTNSITNNIGSSSNNRILDILEQMQSQQQQSQQHRQKQQPSVVTPVESAVHTQVVHSYSLPTMSVVTSTPPLVSLPTTASTVVKNEPSSSSSTLMSVPVIPAVVTVQTVKDHNTITINNNNNIHSSSSSSSVSNGRVEETLADGRRLITYHNGTTKILFPHDDYRTSLISFTNGDTKRLNSVTGEVVYYYKEADTIHTTYSDGRQVYAFPNKQVSIIFFELRDCIIIM